GPEMTDLLLLPGDGIGPEVTRQARRVAQAVAPDLVIEERLFGGSSYDADGLPLTDETLAAAKAAKAVLMGAVGGPKWAGVP
ncbi:isocitrate/isopropylmalate family dehydrogenase, partial [Streptococcus pneumoniae]|nr:isocitrate/isopropylmalate family dehydrogenase [Streptococcus pneumoniae]